MSAEISPLLVRTPAAARPLWLRLRRSSPFTLTVLMCCLALLWISPFIWMLATAFSATSAKPVLSGSAFSVPAGYS